MKLSVALTTILLLAGEGLLTGCATSQFATKPDNVHQTAATLPDNIRRVAVLPLTGQTDIQYNPDGCDTLASVVFEELSRTKKFEVVQASSDVLRNFSGKTTWNAEEALPADFFGSLAKIYSCDAALFCELTLFHPYAPVAVGWRFKLVDVRTRQILWAADEIFDTAQPSVLTSAKRGMREAIAGFYQSPKEDWTDSHSPNRVGQQSAAQLLATLPERK